MSKISVALVLSTSLLSGSSLADTMGSVTRQPDWTWVGTLSAGPVWISSNETKTFYLAPDIDKSYVANKSTSTLFDGEVFVGLQTSLPSNLKGQLGLSVAATSNAGFSGSIWDDADPAFDNYTYEYKIQHTHVAIKGTLLADTGFWLIPWVSCGFGFGFNNAHSFKNTPNIFEALPTPDFASHTETSFVYNLGAGVQKAFNTHWQVGVGYEFTDWGKSSFGRAEGQTHNPGLALNHLYTNGLMFNLTYLA